MMKVLSLLQCLFHCIDESPALVALPFVAMGNSFGVKRGGYTASMKPPSTIITLYHHWECRIIWKTTNAINNDWD